MTVLKLEIYAMLLMIHIFLWLQRVLLSASIMECLVDAHSLTGTLDIESIVVELYGYRLRTAWSGRLY